MPFSCPNCDTRFPRVITTKRKRETDRRKYRERKRMERESREERHENNLGGAAPRKLGRDAWGPEDAIKDGESKEAKEQRLRKVSREETGGGAGEVKGAIVGEGDGEGFAKVGTKVGDLQGGAPVEGEPGGKGKSGVKEQRKRVRRISPPGKEVKGGGFGKGSSERKFEKESNGEDWGEEKSEGNLKERRDKKLRKQELSEKWVTGGIIRVVKKEGGAEPGV